MVYRAGDLRDIYDDTEVQKSHEERRDAMERLETIKNAKAKGPTLWPQLVAEVCAALLSAGSTKGYAFHKVADAPGPNSSSDAPAPTRAVRDRTVNRSQGHLLVHVFEAWKLGEIKETLHSAMLPLDRNMYLWKSVPPFPLQYQLPCFALARSQHYPPATWTVTLLWLLLPCVENS